MGANAIRMDTTQGKGIDHTLSEEFGQLFNSTPLTKDTTCGYGWFKGECLQMYKINKFIYIYIKMLLLIIV